MDGDSILNDKKREEAYKGIANNVEENYVWNIDN